MIFETEPNLDVEEQKKKRSRARLIRLWIYSSLVLTPLFLIMLLGGNSQTPVAETGLPRGLSTATASAERWADSSELSHLVGWVSFDKREVVTEDFTIDVETHRFVVNVSGAQLILSVPVGVDVDDVSWQFGSPSISPVLSVEADVSDSQWRLTGLLEATPRPQFESSIKSWANALFSENPQPLIDIVRDPDPNNIYVSIPGFNVVGEPRLGQPRLRSENLVVIPVNVAIESPDETVYSVSFDVMLSDITSASPSVVAWGPPGSAPSLEPYRNSINFEAKVDTPAPTTTTTEPRNP